MKTFKVELEITTQDKIIELDLFDYFSSLNRILNLANQTLVVKSLKQFNNKQTVTEIKNKSNKHNT